MKQVSIQKNRYVDSVSLMAVSDKAMKLDGVESVEVQMATFNNVALLRKVGYDIPVDISPNDLVIALTAVDETCCQNAFDEIRNIIDHRNGGTKVAHYRSLREIDLSTDSYNLAQISVPSEYVYEEAKAALEMGLDVFIFSDDVPFEEELALKKLGLEKGLMVMGPDSGVGLINGVSLAAGSIVRDGPIGIVTACGSGSQEVACIAEKLGCGVSAILATGGHDLFPQIGGLMMTEGMNRLEQDDKTKVIVLVSKLADIGVMDQMLSHADTLTKPVVSVFLGSDESLYVNHRVHGTYSFEQAARRAVELAGHKADIKQRSNEEIKQIAEKIADGIGTGRDFYRGLFCGGAFSEETIIFLTKNNPTLSLHSNLKNRYCKQLGNPFVSEGNTVLDLGAEDYTKSAPHPVFESSIRNKRLLQEIEDSQVAVIQFDFITGPGVDHDPFSSIVQICKETRRKHGDEIAFVASICGSLEDPQDVPTRAKEIEESGIILANSNYEAARIASAILKELEKRAQ